MPPSQTRHVLVITLRDSHQSPAPALELGIISQSSVQFKIHHKDGQRVFLIRSLLYRRMIITFLGMP